MLQNPAYCTLENHEKQSSWLTETYKFIFAGLNTESLIIIVGLEVEMPFFILTGLKFADNFPLN